METSADFASRFAPRTPAPLRWLNAVGRPARRLLHHDPEALLEDADRQLSEVGDGTSVEWKDALRRYVEACAKTPAHLMGAFHLRNFVRRAVARRVQLERARPRLRPLERPPLVVCGLPRSGTTFLHRLLAEADGTRAPPLWELEEPVPEPAPDRRLARARRRAALMQRFPAFDMDAIHLVRPELPDECSHLFKSSFRSAMQWQVPAVEWLEWHIATPAREAYRDWRDWLSLLQKPGQRLVLKDPYHVKHLPELFAVAPDAMIVRTHRDPLETLPSWHKLIFNMQAILCERLDVPRVVEANTRWAESIANAAIEPGDGVPMKQVLDVDYRRLVADPVGVMREVHEHFDLGWDAAQQARVERYVARNAQRKFGENHYSIEDFGQSEAELKRRFGRYREAFGLDRD